MNSQKTQSSGQTALIRVPGRSYLSWMAKQAKLPTWPKGLKRRLAAARKKAERTKEIEDRKKEIAAAQRELADLKAGRSPRKKK